MSKTMADDKFLVKVWKGDFGLPSIDHNCLTLLACCKFSGVPVEVVTSWNPLFTPTGEFPVFCHGNVILTDVQEINAYLAHMNTSCDSPLSTRDKSNIVAFESSIQEKLLPAILQIWWGDEKNYVDITRPFYAKATRFPLSLWLPGSMQRTALDRIQCRGCGDISDVDRENMIYKDAQVCIDRLSQKLGDQSYFFGQSPSSLDATVFGYLAPLLKLPLNNNHFINHIRSCDNICKLIARITQSYFPIAVPDNPPPSESSPPDPQPPPDPDYPNKRRNIILSGLFALAAMVTYAFGTGMIQIVIEEDEEEQFVKEGEVTTAQETNRQFNHVYNDDGES